MAIFIIKVTTNKEDRALELISTKVHKKELKVYSLATPHGLRAYIFLEAEDRESAEEASYNLPYVKGIIGKTVNYEEIKNMLEPVIEEINIEKGDIVEIIGEPFKKEKARVVRIDKSKEEVVVTLLAAVVPIPVTIKLDNVKVIRREKEEVEEEEGKLRSEIYSNFNSFEEFIQNKKNLFKTYTDDTQLTLHTAEALIRGNGFNLNNFISEYVKWLDDPPIGPGYGCISSIRQLKYGIPWKEAASNSGGNGTAMRISPVGLLYCKDLMGLREAAMKSSAITHSHPAACPE